MVIIQNEKEGRLFAVWPNFSWAIFLHTGFLGDYELDANGFPLPEETCSEAGRKEPACSGSKSPSLEQKYKVCDI